MRKILVPFLVLLASSVSMAEKFEVFEFKSSDYVQKPVGTYIQVIKQYNYKKTPRFLDLMSNTEETIDDTDNLIAFMRASKVCLEKTGDDQFTNSSVNCEVVRESAKNKQVELLTRVLGVSADEMVALVDAGDEAVTRELSKKRHTRHSINRLLWLSLYQELVSKRPFRDSDMRGEIMYKIASSAKDFKRFYDVAPKIIERTKE